MKKSVSKRLNKLYDRILEEKIETKGYCYFVSPDVFERFRKEVYIQFDSIHKTPLYRNLPVFIDMSLLKDTICVFKKYDDDNAEDDFWEHIPTIDCNLE